MSKVSRVSVVWLGVLLAAGYFNVHAARLQEAAGPARSAQATPSPDTWDEGTARNRGEALRLSRPQ